MSDPNTGAPTDLEGGMPATDESNAAATTGAPPDADTLAGLDVARREVLRAVAGQLIPAAHGMPSAADVLHDERLLFVLRSRPDLLEPLLAALRPGLGDPAERLRALQDGEPDNLAALQLVIVGGYYTDKRVRELIGYPGQEAIEVRSWEMPPYLEEGLIDAVLARGPIWRDPATGRRAANEGYPKTYAERWSQAASQAGGQDDGRDST